MTNEELNEQLNKKPSLAERLSKFSEYERGAMLGQAINLAQNHVLEIWEWLKQHDPIKNLPDFVKDFYPQYLELLVEAKERFNNYQKPPF